MNDFAPDDLVPVSPRYLAGGGTNKINDVVGPLVHLFNWPYEHDPCTGRINIDSPCGSVFIGFTHDREDGVWWTIAHHEPYWQIEFSRQTPIEAIASVTQSLPQLLGDCRFTDRIALANESVAQLAKSNGWDVKTTASGVLWTSPDEHCTVEHSTDPVHPWRIEHSVYDGLDTHWTATFTPDVPEQLVAQFFTHLASSTPVERIFREVPDLVQHSGHGLITPVRGTAVNPHAHHAVTQAARAHTDLAARTAVGPGYRPDPDHPATKKSPSAATSGQTTGHLARASDHYTQNLAPPGEQTTPQKQLDGIDHHSRIRVHPHALHQPAVTLEPAPPPAPATGTRPRPRPRS